MDKRPLCVALGLAVLLILIFRGELEASRDPEYGGEEKSVRCQVEEIQGQGESLCLIVSDITENGKFLCSRMKVYQSAGGERFSDLKVGNILSLQGTINSFFHPGNPGQFDEFQYYRNQGISYLFYARRVSVEDPACRRADQWLCELRQVLYRQIMNCLPEEEGGVVAAMLLGEKCALTEEVRTLYQENGIAHILAISGLHISLIGTGLFFLLRRFVMPMKPAALVTGGLLMMYGELSGFSVSAQRAVCMMLCLLAARFLGRRYDPYCALALSALIQLCIHPLVLFQSGFLLSYGTVLGIALFVQRFQELAEKHQVIRKAVLGSLGIQFVTLPVLLFFYYEFNPYSVLVNLAVLPFVGMILALSAAGSAVSGIHAVAGRFLYGGVHYILRMYHLIGGWVRELPWAQITVGRPAPWRIVLYYALIFLWIAGTAVRAGREERKEDKRRSAPGVILVIALCILFVPLPAAPGLSITNLDVGQGDCSCIRLGSRTVLIDGGSSDVDRAGKYRISRYLKYHGIGSLDYIFITHSDSDHVNGIRELIEDHRHMGFNIGTVVLPDIADKDEGYGELERICRTGGMKVEKMKKGDSIHMGEAEFRCIHPYPDYKWHTENDYSLVLALDYRQFHGIFTGDLEMAGEKEILDQVTEADYLKVGHHGSAGSSGEDFLKAVRPDIAVISAGRKNRYGHPAPETIQRLKRAGANIYCTMDSGAVTLETDGEKMAVSTYK